MSIHLKAVIDMFLHVPRKFSYRSFIYFFYGNSTFYWRLPSKFKKKNFVYSGRKTSSLNNFPN
jgi:hypothetical protein